jgi:hypothetical protein
LLAGGPAPAAVPPLGIVTHAEHAYIGSAAASMGSSIYEGDRMSTEVDGTLRVSIPALTLQLNAQTVLTVRPPDKADDEVETDLASGTLVFSAAETGKIVVMADGAMVRPALRLPTIAQIRLVSPRELRIYAQRGAVEFFYRGESDVIAQGTACQVLLDPIEREIAMATEPEPNGTKPAQGKKSGKSRPAFLLVAIGIAAGIAIPMAEHHPESPDNPGHGHKPHKKPGD